MCSQRFLTTSLKQACWKGIVICYFIYNIAMLKMTTALTRLQYKQWRQVVTKLLFQQMAARLSQLAAHKGLKTSLLRSPKMLLCCWKIEEYLVELCARAPAYFAGVGKLRQTKLWKIISYFNELLVMEKLSWMIWSYYKV